MNQNDKNTIYITDACYNENKDGIDHTLGMQDKRLQAKANVVNNSKSSVYTTSSTAVEEPLVYLRPQMKRSIIINIILIGSLASLNGILTNVATSVLPESWKEHLWVAWVLVFLNTGVSTLLAIRQMRLESEGKQLVTQALAERSRQQLLNCVYKEWILNRRNKALMQSEILSLELENRPDAIESRFDEVAQRPLNPQPILSGTKISDILEQSDNSLLILGEPGTGKSIMLYELTNGLLDRANQDEKDLIPVLFHLSLWAEKRRPLVEWLVETLEQFYGIDSQIAQMWINEQRILPLLDGLDEIAVNNQAECVDAINKFYHNNKLAGLVVCSRFKDYERLTSKLEIQLAILVKPLTQQQVDTHLKNMGNTMCGVRAVLRDDPELYELMKTPLWLNTVISTYQNVVPQKLRSARTIEDRRREILRSHIQEMFKRKGKIRKDATSTKNRRWIQRKPSYTEQQMIEWLTWLARQMIKRSQSIFEIEDLQADWHHSKYAHEVHALLTILCVGLLSGVVSALIFGIYGGLAKGLLVGLYDSLWGGLGGAILISTLFGVFGERAITPIERFNWSLRSGLSFGLITGLAVGLSYGLNFGLDNGLIVGLGSGLIGGLIGGKKDMLLLEELKNLWKVRLVFSLFVVLLSIPMFSLFVDLRSALPIALLAGVVTGLLGESRVMRIESEIRPNQGIRYSTINGLIYGILGMMVFGMLGVLGLGAIGMLSAGLLVGSYGGLIWGLMTGGGASIKHFALRIMLYYSGHTPWNYAQFLDSCVQRNFLCRSGRGYTFNHSLLMEYFATLTDADIKRIVNSNK